LRFAFGAARFGQLVKVPDLFDDLPDAETVRKKIRAAKRGRVRK